MKNQVEELKEIGMNIVRLRHARGITQEKLAEAAGVCDVYMRSIEHGRANVS
ncbi:MAG: helix-turn-helix domain-containing protein, partial [Oscillospiraceae bacterium]|nr:helix-turn-helix domain-containing protein [Oscillospiraceae bacterium]MCI8526096.1 helix-turn-helix domain-containing protein [Oscillospiraceae bacterium]